MLVVRVIENCPDFQRWTTAVTLVSLCLALRRGEIRGARHRKVKTFSRLHQMQRLFFYLSALWYVVRAAGDPLTLPWLPRLYYTGGSGKVNDFFCGGGDFAGSGSRTRNGLTQD